MCHGYPAAAASSLRHFPGSSQGWHRDPLRNASLSFPAKVKRDETSHTHNPVLLKNLERPPPVGPGWAPVGRNLSIPGVRAVGIFNAGRCLFITAVFRRCHTLQALVQTLELASGLECLFFLFQDGFGRPKLSMHSESLGLAGYCVCGAS